ncbi:MAG: patatin-like phospholipase family protein [Bdellovibrionales bacterium]|nr:patatin-like phospholipase family protein [Bdellovibrionales bacterium]
MRLRERQRVALALSGGGVKAAAFHIGVCLALREKGFVFAGGPKETVDSKFSDNALTFKTYVGSSAGSVISTFLACGYDIDSIIEAFLQGTGFGRFRRRKADTSGFLKPLTYKDIFGLNLKASHPTRFINRLFRKQPVITGGLEVLLKRGIMVDGLFTTDNLEKYFRENVVGTNDFAQLGVELYIIATQLNHSRKVIFGPFSETTKDDRIKYAGYSSISQAVAASASLPPFFAPYGIKNNAGKEIFFFDGEIRDTLSTHVADDHGCDLVISSYSMQPYHYNAEIGSLTNYGMPLIFNQALYQLVQQKIASHIENQEQISHVLFQVENYLKENNTAPEIVDHVIDIITRETNFKRNVQHIYIHPRPEDYEMFFADHFSLRPKILSKIVKTGFKAAMNTLRPYEI